MEYARKRLIDTSQGHRIMVAVWDTAKPLLAAGKVLQLTLTDEPRNLPQNDAIQGIVRSIGAKLGRTDHDLLRMLLMEQFNRETDRAPVLVPSFDGKRWVDVSNSTKNLQKTEGSEFIDFLRATDAEL